MQAGRVKKFRHSSNVNSKKSLAMGLSTLRLKFSQALAALIFFSISGLSNHSKAEIYKPYALKSKDKLEFPHENGYCKNPAEERKLWEALNLFASSVLSTFPEIPPEQKRYIEAEGASGNMDRQIAILKNPIYIFNQYRAAMLWLKTNSALYIDNQGKLSHEKKGEFIGRAMLNLSVESDLFENANDYSRKLGMREYIVAADKIRSFAVGSNTLKDHLIYHLICYGERLTQDRKK